MAFLLAFLALVIERLFGYPDRLLQAIGHPVIWIGSLMAFLTVFYALVENDLRRVVTYALQTQLGLIVIGIGIGTALSLNGAVLHAAMGIFYIALLLMALGAVMERAGTAKATELGGLASRMPWTTGFALVGGAAISAFPLMNGYISKSPILSAAAQEGLTLPWLAMMFASVGIFIAVAIRLPRLAFFGEPRSQHEHVREAPQNMIAAMATTATFCLLAGLMPGMIYELAPYAFEYRPYTADKLIEQLQLLAFAGLAAWWLAGRGRFPVLRAGRALDSDWIYLRAAPAVVSGIRHRGGRVWHGAVQILRWPLVMTVRAISHHHGPQGVLARTWPTGSMVFWVAVILAGSLLVYYF
jgi:multicomponent Na+:H+ antiporter subunit D